MSIPPGQDKASIPLREIPGLTAIEIVVVTAVLAILAGFAVPRIVAVRAATPSVATVALGRDLRIAVARTHAIWLAENQPAQLRVDDRLIRFVYGYPDRASIDSTVGGFEGFRYDDSEGLFARLGRDQAPVPDCGVSYQPPTATGEAPRIAVVTEGC